MKPQIQLYEDPAERRRKRRDASKKSHAAWNQAFGERLTKATADFQAKTGRTFTHSELAAMLRERVGKPITPRYVSRCYRGLAGNHGGLEYMMELADIFDVAAGWLCSGAGERKRMSRGVYRSDDGYYTLDNTGQQIASVTFDAGSADKNAVLEKCYELLDIVSPDQPNLRVVK